MPRMNKNTVYRLKLFSGPFAAIVMSFLMPPLSMTDPQVNVMAGIALWVAIWWLTEPVHLSVTALLPFLLLPLSGILDTRAVAAQYMDQVIFLFIGGFILAFGIERWGLHRRLAYRILSGVGSSPASILAGIMSTSFFISMWISNTATVMMLLSAVIAVISQTDLHFPQSKDKIANALLLGLAFSASIGGMSTLVGTPTNMIFLSFYQNHYHGGPSISFARWMMLGFPIALILLSVTFLVIKAAVLGKSRKLRLDTSEFRKSYVEMGPMSYEEKVVTFLFALTALLWFFRVDIDLGGFRIPGWSGFFKHAAFIQDSTVAVFMAFFLFLIPSRKEPGRALLTWEEARKLPFGIILLFGSGFALAKGFESSGLSRWLAGQLVIFGDAPPFLLIILVCVLVIVLSEFASNVATIQLFLPVLAALSTTMNMSPLFLLVPATFAASAGFMLPVATAPNTIVFGTGRIKVRTMMGAGLGLDMAAAILITVFTVLASFLGKL
jgi:solute carrier family 13 (sodium-dependent dicarboxylate transporter), member 2/3/5